MDNAFRALQRFGRCARCSSPVVSSQQSQTCGSKLGDIRPLAKRMEYESIGDPNRCLLPTDHLTPVAVSAVAALQSTALAVSARPIQRACVTRETPGDRQG